MSEPTYRADLSVQNIHRKRYHRRRRVALAATMLAVILGAALWFDLIHLNNSQSPNLVGATFERTIAGPTTFKSAYFQFSDTNAWQYAPNDSTAQKISFLLYQDGVVAHSITVYVNQTPLSDDLAVTHVLPVSIVGGNSFSVGDLSPACVSTYKPGDLMRIKTVSLSGTSMLCVPDSPQYAAVAGQVGGDYNLMLRRLSGQLADYIIIYRNLTVSPDPSVFLNVMKTFKAL